MRLKPSFSYFLLSIAYCLFSVLSYAQPCGTDQLLRNILQTEPNASQILQQNREAINNYINHNGNRDSRNAIVTIPVVFHIIHNGQIVGTGSNISVAQIQSQLDVLNEHFRLRNADTSLIPPWFQGRQADIEVEFCLASFDASGNATSGITRHNYANLSNFDVTIKPVTQWDPTLYLNFWTTVLSGPLLGYATFPNMGPADQDGIVVDYREVGKTPINPNGSLGKTAVHEVGHWLNLFHTFQDSCSGMTPQTCDLQGDWICDTPPSYEAAFGAPGLTQNTCHESPVDEFDMWMNYMDYADEDQLHLFTRGQRDVIRATLSTSRLSIQSSYGCHDASNVFAVSGQVVDASNSAPISNARVYFDGQSDYETTTDGNGNFTISSAVEGNYDVYAGKWGYMTKQFMVNTLINSVTTGMLIPIDNQHYYDDFLMDFSWTMNNTSSSGFLTRAIPVGTSYLSEAANPFVDEQNDFGLKCMVSGNSSSVATADDIDNGSVTLISPSFDLSSYTDPYLRYSRWFYNGSQSGNACDDKMTVKLNNGSVNVTLETIDSAQAPTNLWMQKTFRISDYVTPTNNMRLIIDASDLTISNPNIVEMGFDRFEVIEGIALSAGETENEKVDIAVFPNPSSGIVNVKYVMSGTEKVSLKVMNVMGEEILSNEISHTTQGLAAFDMRNQAQGIYFIRLQTQLSEKTLKFSLLH